MTTLFFTVGADKSYTAGDIISRNVVDYTVKVAGWANAADFVD